MAKIKIDTLFKDGENHYAVYAGVVQGKAILAGSIKQHKIDPVLLGGIKEGARVYFNAEGEVVKVKATKATKEATKTGTSGSNVTSKGIRAHTQI